MGSCGHGKVNITFKHQLASANLILPFLLTLSANTNLSCRKNYSVCLYSHPGIGKAYGMEILKTIDRENSNFTSIKELD